nr:1-deoxy-D-xylulose-5-phosphate synthase [Gammaproteobacteria bacterium]
MLYTGYQLDSPAAVRYPRGTGPGAVIEADMRRLATGKAQMLRQGRKIAILGFGSAVRDALLAGETLNASVVNMRFIKPLDEAMVTQLACEHDVLVTVEDNAIAGGAGGAVNECLVRLDDHVTVLNLGLPDRFLEHGSREQLLAEAGIDAPGIVASIESLLDVKRPRATARSVSKASAS